MAEPAVCPCDFCEAERWVARALEDPTVPAVVRVGLLELALHLTERRTVGALVRSRGRRGVDVRAWWERLGVDVRAWWERLGERALRAVDWMAGEAGVVIALALWCSVWFWGSVVLACLRGSWSLRGLVLAAAVGWVVGNRAGLRRLRGED